MRIIYIHQYFSDFQSNTSTRSYSIAKKMVSSGHHVTMLTTNNFITSRKGQKESIKYGYIDGIYVISVNIKYNQTFNIIYRIFSFFLFLIFSLWYVLKYNHTYNLIFSSSTPLTVGIPPLIAKMLFNKPYIFEARDIWPDVPIALGIIKNSFIKYLLYYIESKIYLHAVHIIVLSSDAKYLLINKHVPPVKISIIPNFAYIKLFHPEITPVLPEKLDRFKNSFLCIHSGTLGFVNNIDFILNVADRLKVYKDIHFIIIGEGKEKNRLKDICEKKKLDKVHFFESIPKIQLPSVIQACDVCLMTVAGYKILEANSANKFFDYLASGKPVLINYKGWMKNKLINNKAGFSSAPNDVLGFSDNILKLYNNVNLKNKYSHNARLLAEREYSVDTLTDKVCKIIKGI